MQRQRFALTIKQRLMALIVLSTLLIVGSLTAYFTSLHIGEITDNLHGKATAYTQLVRGQVMSAVAFSDRETAREVLASIAADTDIDAVTLTGQGGEVLFAHGTAQHHPPPGGEPPRTYATTSRIIATTPVVSLEGPRGALVLELSTRRVAVARARLVWIAVVTGGAALVLAVVLAWLIARGVALRLRAIGSVASAVASGDLSQQPVDDTRRDEIGALAAAFNAMLTQLKQLIDRVRDMAQKEQARLETLVAERTAELELRNTEMRLVFDHVEQGLLVVDLDGTIACEHSAAVERWLGGIPASYRLADLMRGFAPEQAEWFVQMWQTLDDGMLPLELAVTQLPARFVAAGRHLTWSYKPFPGAGGTRRILIVISDVTAEVLRQRSERDEREVMSLLSRMLHDRAGFVEGHGEAKRLVEAIVEGPTEGPAFARAVHTLKGMSGFLDLGALVEACHALETALADGDGDACAAERARIAARWQFLSGKLAPFLGETAGKIDVHERDLARLDAAIARNATLAELARMVADWRDERAVDRFARIAEQVRSIAARIGKAPVDVRIDADPELRLPATLAPMWCNFVHAVRNSLDHGAEARDERIAAGKPPAPVIALRARLARGELVLEIADDGRGIAWDRVAAAAAARGLPSETPADLEEALFHDGLSTRGEVSETSGRGVGMAALRAACMETGGRLSVTSTPGAGTTLRFTWSTSRPRSFSVCAAVVYPS